MGKNTSRSYKLGEDSGEEKNNEKNEQRLKSLLQAWDLSFRY